MARTMNIKTVDIYRAVVQSREASGRIYTTVFGPHDASNQARNQWSDWNRVPVRVQKQKLIAQYDEVDQEPFLMWDTIKTTYANGGEGVDWDDA